MNIEEKVDNHYGRNYYYVGEFNNGTDDRDGIGITVFDIGYIYEGYWKDNKANGQGRNYFWNNKVLINMN